MPGLEKNLEGAVDAALSEVDKANVKAEVANLHAKLGVRPVPVQASIGDQLTRLQLVEHELRARIRRERGAIIAEHDRRWVDIQNDYAQRIPEEVARLEKLRDDELKELAAATAERLRENELVAKRMG